MGGGGPSTHRRRGRHRERDRERRRQKPVRPARATPSGPPSPGGAPGDRSVRHGDPAQAPRRRLCHQRTRTRGAEAPGSARRTTRSQAGSRVMRQQGGASKLLTVLCCVRKTLRGSGSAHAPVADRVGTLPRPDAGSPAHAARTRPFRPRHWPSARCGVWRSPFWVVWV